jgi:hypothetical protein
MWMWMACYVPKTQFVRKTLNEGLLLAKIRQKWGESKQDKKNKIRISIKKFANKSMD